MRGARSSSGGKGSPCIVHDSSLEHDMHLNTRTPHGFHAASARVTLTPSANAFAGAAAAVNAPMLRQQGALGNFVALLNNADDHGRDKAALLPELALILSEAEVRNLDEETMQKELDETSDKQSEQKFDGIPKFVMPVGFHDDIHMYDYQKDGIRWLFHQETNTDRVSPFWKESHQGRGLLWKSPLTGKTQMSRPTSPRASILADGALVTSPKSVFCFHCPPH